MVPGVPGEVKSDLRAKTVLVTGSTGFLGRHLCSHLLSAGADVIGVSRQRGPEKDDHPGYCAVSADLSQPTVAATLLSRYKPDLIYHLAGEVCAAQEVDLLLPMFHQNLATSVYLFQALVRHNRIKVITIGSIEELSSDKIPASPYGMAKQAARLYADFFRVRYQLPIVQTRLHLAYGPGQSYEKLIPHVIGSYLRGKAPVLRTPNRICDFVYVDDVAAALLSAESQSGMGEEILEIRSGIAHSLHAVTKEIASILGSDLEPEYLEVPDRQALFSVDQAAAPQNPNWPWRAQASLAQGLKRTVEWYKNQIR